MIVIIDYGVGNVRSVTNALVHIGCDVKVSCAAADIEQAEGLILPGVGAAAYAMAKLKDIAELIRSQADSGKALLGICLGYQLLFDRSLEHGSTDTLGLIHGQVIPIPPGRTIPHMGWNYVNLPAEAALFDGLGKGRHFAFAHSYYADVTDPDAEVAYTDYGMNISAAAVKGNVFGCQFHPEKSGGDGLKILKNFELICKEKL